MYRPLPLGSERMITIMVLRIIKDFVGGLLLKKKMWIQYNIF
jgi:hypothetical protein